MKWKGRILRGIDSAGKGESQMERNVSMARLKERKEEETQWKEVKGIPTEGLKKGIQEMIKVKKIIRREGI